MLPHEKAWWLLDLLSRTDFVETEVAGAKGREVGTENIKTWEKMYKPGWSWGTIAFYAAVGAGIGAGIYTGGTIFPQALMYATTLGKQFTYTSVSKGVQALSALNNVKDPILDKRPKWD